MYVRSARMKITFLICFGSIYGNSEKCFFLITMQRIWFKLNVLVNFEELSNWLLGRVTWTAPVALIFCKRNIFLPVKTLNQKIAMCISSFSLSSFIYLFLHYMFLLCFLSSTISLLSCFSLILFLLFLSANVLRWDTSHL